jgi:hypothetical protein
MKRMVSVSMSRIKKMKGRSMVTSMGVAGTDVNPTITAVAAAASVPASSTETKDLWITSDIKRSRLPVIPEKSALSEKATGMPKAESVLFRLKLDMNSNFGMVRLISLD